MATSSPQRVGVAAGIRERNSGIGGTSALAQVGFQRDWIAHSGGGSVGLRSTVGALGKW
jgi:hypothetical protein